MDVENAPLLVRVMYGYARECILPKEDCERIVKAATTWISSGGACDEPHSVDTFRISATRYMFHYLKRLLELNSQTAPDPDLLLRAMCAVFSTILKVSTGANLQDFALETETRSYLLEDLLVTPENDSLLE